MSSRWKPSHRLVSICSPTPLAPLRGKCWPSTPDGNWREVTCDRIAASEICCEMLTYLGSKPALRCVLQLVAQEYFSSQLRFAAFPCLSIPVKLVRLPIPPLPRCSCHFSDASHQHRWRGETWIAQIEFVAERQAFQL